MKTANQTIVGIFTVGAIVLFLCGVFFLGGKDLFEKDKEYVTYFDSSVNGLNVGAPVVLRGVPLGKVTRVSLVANPKDSSVSIPVYFTINRKSLIAFDGRDIDEDLEHRMIRRMVDMGLRAHLEVRSMITGQLCIELNYEPDVPAKYQSNTPELEIPSAASPIEEFAKVLGEIPFDRLSKSLEKILGRISAALEHDDLKRGLEGFANLMEDLRAVIKDPKWKSYEERVDAIMAILPVTMESMNRTATNMAAASGGANALLDKNSPAMQDLRRLLRDGAEASRSLRNLADMLERNPEALIKGKKGGR